MFVEGFLRSEAFHHPRSVVNGKRVRSRESLSDYIARYVREMESGERLNIHKLRYGLSTVKNYKGFIVQFDEFCRIKHKRYDFGDIDLRFYDDFVAYFTTKDYSINDRSPYQGTENYYARSSRGGLAR